MAEYNGFFRRLIGSRIFGEFYLLDSGSLTPRYVFSDLHTDTEAVISLAEFCQEHDTPFLYTVLPAKALYDEDFTKYGLSQNKEALTDVFVKDLDQAGVHCLDLRQMVKALNENPYDAFYYGDHHQTVSTGLEEARAVSAYLNDELGVYSDTQILKEENLHREYYEDCWVGESSRKTGVSYLGLEDYEYIAPVIPTSFHFTDPGRGIDLEGDFTVMVRDTFLNGTMSTEESRHYAYLYGNSAIQYITNNMQDRTRILVIKDSHSQVINPFLAMTVSEITSWDVRYNNNSLREYIASGDFDAVILMYSQTMFCRTLNGKYMFDLD